MATKNVEQRRKIRKLEAARDELMIRTQKTRTDLAKIRTELKHAKKG